MTNLELFSFIKLNHNTGASEQEIRTALKTYGNWKDEEISEAFAEFSETNEMPIHKKTAVTVPAQQEAAKLNNVEPRIDTTDTKEEVSMAKISETQKVPIVERTHNVQNRFVVENERNGAFGMWIVVLLVMLGFLILGYGYYFLYY